MSRSSPGERVLHAEGMAAAPVYSLSLSCWIMLLRALSTKLCPWQMLSPHLLNLQEKLYSQGETENSYAAVPLIKQQGYIIENNPT